MNPLLPAIVSLPQRWLTRNGQHALGELTYLRQAAVKAGILKVGAKVRFGFHNLRHSLSTYLVEKGEDPKTVQGILRLAKVTTALDIYSHVVPEKARAAQSRFTESLLSEEKKTAALKNAKPVSEVPQ